ncbi:MAG: 50S ribosomal protein L29 [Bacteroidia bacterium]|nr:50S ribosomal protein L29 [Bacteroidia bacterium]NNM16833.1 50S ribosomal protein L29 [Bacteroidia bacterium]
MKASIVKELTTDEIVDRIKEERENWKRMKLNHAVSPLENPLQLQTTRRFIARLETELKGRKMAETKETKDNK